jgi:hypothetical protein
METQTRMEIQTRMEMVWDESYNHDGYVYRDEDEYNFIGMSMGCSNLVGNFSLTPLVATSHACALLSEYITMQLQAL